MSNDNREAILKKMRALAMRANPEFNNFQEEMDTASRMLEKMMAQYQVTWVELMADKMEEQRKQFEAGQCDSIIGRVKPWHWSLARAIGKITNTKHYIRGAYGHTFRMKAVGYDKTQARGYMFMFFGQAEMVGTATMLFEKWMEVIYNMSRTAVKEYIAELTEKYAEEMEFEGVKQVRHLNLGSEHPNVWQNSWLEGVLYGIHETLYEQEQERKRSSAAEDKKQINAIVLVSSAVAEAYQQHSKDIGMRNVSTSGNSNTNWDARQSGRKVGKGLNLNQSELSAGRKRLKGGG